VSFDQFTDERGQKTILSNMTLDKKQVGVNKELLMTMESKGKILPPAGSRSWARREVLRQGQLLRGRSRGQGQGAQ